MCNMCCEILNSIGDMSTHMVTHTSTSTSGSLPSTSGSSNAKAHPEKNPSTPSPREMPVPTSSFGDIMTTPKISKPKTIRRKSLNYQSQHVTRNLFAQTAPSSEVKTKGKGKVNKKGGKAVPVKNNNTSWYCPICKENRMIDMRACYKCSTYVHEECVGLTKYNKDIFLCFNCDTDTDTDSE